MQPGEDRVIRVPVDEDADLYAFAYSPDLFPFPCESVGLTGDGATLPKAELTYEATFLDTPRFELLVDQPPEFELIGSGCRAECPPITVTHEPFKMPQQTRFVVPLESDEFLVADQNANFAFRRRDGSRTDLPRDARLSGELESLSFKAPDTVVAACQGAAFSIDPTGRIQLVDLVEPYYLTQVALAKDRTAVISGQRPGHEYVLIRLAAGSTVGVGVEVPFTKFLVAPLDDGVVLAAEELTGDVYSLQGTTWIVEYSARHPDGLLSDGSTALLLTGQEAHLRAAGADWQILPPIPASTSVTGVASLGSGRYLLVGAAGVLSIWTGSRWCEYDTKSGVSFKGVATETNARPVALAFGSVRGEGVVAKIELPDAFTR